MFEKKYIYYSCDIKILKIRRMALHEIIL